MNIICPDWEILATEDHSAVMPLPVSKSLGRKIIRQPEYAWQLGVFSTRVPSPDVIQHFIKSIPPSYRLRRMCLSKFNSFPSGRARYLNASELDLIQPYSAIKLKYGPSLQKSLELAKKESLSHVNNISVNDMLMFAYKLDAFNQSRLKPKDISILRLIISNALRFRSARISAAYDSHNNQTI